MRDATKGTMVQWYYAIEGMYARSLDKYIWIIGMPVLLLAQCLNLVGRDCNEAIQMFVEWGGRIFKINNMLRL